MTRRTNARIAGAAFLLYIAFGIGSMMLFGTATRGEGIVATLATLAGHETELRLGAVLTLLCSFAALTLGVTMHAITRDEDHDLAMLALACRLVEGMIGAIAVQKSLALLWLATTTGVQAPQSVAVHAIGAFLEGQTWSPTIAALFFAVGSTLFSWLLLRGRMIPVVLAWIGVGASLLLVVLLPLQIAGFARGPIIGYAWGPMAIFEVWLALHFLIKGAAWPRARMPAEAAA